jgi:hypothetical protein
MDSFVDVLRLPADKQLIQLAEASSPVASYFLSRPVLESSKLKALQKRLKDPSKSVSSIFRDIGYPFSFPEPIFTSLINSPIPSDIRP